MACTAASTGVQSTLLGPQYTDLRTWYHSEQVAKTQADQIFLEAKKIYADTLTRDGRKVAFLSDKVSLSDITSIVSRMKLEYEVKRQSSKARRWLSAFSSRVNYYGSIMDVLVQQSPEYVSLAWGAMKLLFVGVQNHDTLVATLSKALCRMADALSRYEKILYLYQTNEIRDGVMQLYTHFLKFLIRAMLWYDGGSVKRAISSFVKPAAIQYKDILEDIEESSRRLDKAAELASYTEQRAMHLEQRQMRVENRDNYHTLGNIMNAILSMQPQVATVGENHLLAGEILQVVLAMQPQIAQLQAEQNRLSRAVFDTNDRVYDVQLSSMLTYTATVPGLDPQEHLRLGIIMRNRRRVRPGQSQDASLNSPVLRAWTTSSTSALVIVKGSVTVQNVAKDFCVNIIEHLRSTSTPVIWLLKDPKIGEKTAFTPADFLKTLVYQALQTNKNLHDEKSMALKCASIQSARTESEWIDILGASLVGLPLVYIVVDIEVQRLQSTFGSSFSWPWAFRVLFERLSSKGFTTNARVLLVSCGKDSRYLTSPAGSIDHNAIVPITAVTNSKSHARSRLSPRLYRRRG